LNDDGNHDQQLNQCESFGDFGVVSHSVWVPNSRVARNPTPEVSESSADCYDNRNHNKQEKKKTDRPVTPKGIRTPSERFVSQPQILPSPDVSLKRHHSCAAFGQYLHRLRMLGAQPGVEAVLQN
jgi:hypothetical protein